jgi:hypothetical protein
VKKNRRNNIFFLFEKKDKTQGYTGKLGSEIITTTGPRQWRQKCLLVFLNAYRNNPQAHEITIVAFHPEVFRVSYFHKEQRCKSLLSSSSMVTRRKIARVVRFSKDRDPKLRWPCHYKLALGTSVHLVCQAIPACSRHL